MDISKHERKLANRVIDSLLSQFKGKSILQLLPVISLRCSRTVVQVAVERVERKKNGLARDDLVFFEQFKLGLAKG